MTHVAPHPETAARDLGGCPVIHRDFAPERPAGCHWDEADELREQSPVFFNAFAQGYWIFTRHDAVRDIYKTPELFSSESITPWQPDPIYRFVPTQIDAPDHIKYRRIVNPWFSPRAVDAAEERMRALCRGLVEEVAPAGGCDFVTGFALRFPTEAFLSMAGIDPADADLFVPWVEDFFGGFSGDPAGLEPMAKAGLMGPDNEYIHCTRSGNEAIWKTIADTGGKVSIAPAIEMQMRHGMPPLQAALDHGIRPSLSVDVECNMTADMFSIMRAAYTLQRALVNQRALSGEEKLPPLLTCRDVIEFATVSGATVAHLDSKIGTLTPGKEADVIMLATERINTFPLNNAPGTVVTLMDTSNVENVFVAGKVVKWQGKLVGVDLHRLRVQIENSRDGLLARSGQSPNLFGTCCAIA